MKTLLYLLFLSTLFFGCKKYPDDKSWVHLKRPEKRLCGKKLQFVIYEINGVDSIPYVNSKLLGGKKLTDFIIETDTYKNAHIIEPYQELVMEINKDKTKLRIWHKSWQGGLSYPVFFQDESNYWDIKRLEKNSLVIEINKNSKLYRLEFNIT